MTADEVAAALTGYAFELNAMKRKIMRVGHVSEEANYRRIELEVMNLLSDHLRQGAQLRQAFFQAPRTNPRDRNAPLPTFDGLGRAVNYLEATAVRINRDPSLVKAAISSSFPLPSKAAALESIISRLPQIMRQLAKRQRDRQPFEVNDEYDLQDLVHALLRSIFDDIRPEDWTPSYAGNSSRLDFYLPQIEAVIELKMMRPSLSAKELANQLIIDAIRYQTFPGCKTLYCVVYDPDGHIPNPRGVETDLVRATSQITVKASILS